MKPLRIVIGIALWTVAVFVVWRWATPKGHEQDSVGQRVVPQLWRFAAGQRQAAPLKLGESVQVAARDPIFVLEGPGRFRQVGEVRVAESGERAAALLYPTAPVLGDGARLTFYESPDSAEWVLKTMLPPHKREQIGLEVRAALEEHHEEILAAFKPIAEQSLRDAFEVLEEDLPAAIEKRRGEFETLGSKYQRDIVEREIVPLVRREIWPIVRRRAEPTANEVGREIWERVSLWRFGWRYAYDAAPFTDQRLVDGEWRRFVNEEALPVLESHTSDFIRVQQQILADVARNEEVRLAVRRSLSQMLEDPELQQLVWEVVQASMIDNSRMQEAMRRNWSGAEAQDALRLASDRLEPTIESIGALVLGTPEQGVTPEFARVLRNQVLNKDKRWLVLDPGLPAAAGGGPREAITLDVRRGEGDPVSPFVAEASGTVVLGDAR